MDNINVKNLELERQWKDHKKKYHLKLYSIEDCKCYMSFVKTYKFIRAHNAMPDKSFAVCMNHLAHWPEEKLDNWLCCRSVTSNTIFHQRKEFFVETYRFDPLYKAPPYFDWRDHNAVQVVKDQKECGACWAFATVAVVESVNYINTSTLLNLSEQQLIDGCKKNDGCSGGWPEYGMEFAIENGLTDSCSYPFTGKDGKLKKKKPLVKGWGIRRIEANESSLMQAVSRFGPVAVAISANHPEFISYSHGVYFNDNAVTNQPDHAVVVVGYGTMAHQDYWIVKNSWSENWGIKGYMLMARNRNNNSGIASFAVQIVHK